MKGLTVSQKPAGLDLMQNCDLPPPSKVFKGSDKTVMLSMNSKDFVTHPNQGGANCDQLELLKALRSSQTRAREAENKAAILIKERNCLSNALLEEAMHLYAYRQQVRLLDLQISNLQSLWLQQQQEMFGCCATRKEDDDGEERVSLVWILALALSWGIGVGTALACRYFL